METTTQESRYGPTLPELVRPRWRRLSRWQKALALVGVAALLAAGVLYYRSRVASIASFERQATSTSPAFTFKHDESMGLRDPLGEELARIQSSRNGVVAQRMVVSPLRLEDRPGRISARLPLDAVDYRQRAERRWRGYRQLLEGRTRLNGVEAYQLVFTGRIRPPGSVERQLFGKIVLLPEPLERPRKGLAIEMIATTLSPVHSATMVGDTGVMKRPFRSLRLLGYESLQD